MGLKYDLNDKYLRIYDYPYPKEQAVEVRLDGQTIWHLTPARNRWARLENSELIIEWPYSLADRFKGNVKISLAKGERELASGSFQVGDSEKVFRLVDEATGKNQIVNKWGRLSQTLEMKDVGIVDKLLGEVRQLIVFAKEKAGIELFATGATLLGAMRGGKIVAGDDDADLAYLSECRNPSDIGAESFRLERILCDGDYDVVRHSNGHLQLYFPPRDYHYDFYIDIFTYFVVSDNFYGTFHAFKPADQVKVLPLQKKKLNGYDIPVPCDSAAVLEAIYGEDWRVPDPSFTFMTPERVGRRYFHWVGDIFEDVENWEGHHREVLIGGGPDRDIGNVSEFAQYVRSDLSGPATIFDLGSGLSGDAEEFAAAGHEVYAVDYSRPSILWRERNPVPGVKAHRLNMYSTRDVIRLAALLGQQDGPVVLYGKNWWEALNWGGYLAMLPLIRQLIAKNVRRPGRVSFYFETIAGEEEKYKNFEFYRRIGWERLRDWFALFGIEPVELERKDARIRYSLFFKSPAY